MLIRRSPLPAARLLRAVAGRLPPAPPYQLDDPDVAKSPLVFPTASMNAKAHDYYTFKDYNDFQSWNNTFNPIIQS